MSNKIVIKLTSEEYKNVLEFSNLIHVDVQRLAKQSLFMAIQAAYQRMDRMQAAEDEKNGLSTQRDTAGDTSTVSEGRDVNPPVLADTESLPATT